MSAEFDERPVSPRHYMKEVIAQLERAREKHRDDPAFTPKQRERLFYLESILSYGNASGNSNETINLPENWKVQDLETVLGVEGDPPEPGSDAAWRIVKRRFDNANAGRSGGRTL
jgi:hypothetical protein